MDLGKGLLPAAQGHTTTNTINMKNRLSCFDENKMTYAACGDGSLTLSRWDGSH